VNYIGFDPTCGYVGKGPNPSKSNKNIPNGILDSWNSSTHFCKWPGIVCSPKHQRVTKLKLPGYKLHGSISPYVGNLSHLRFLNLGNNGFYGNIPQETGRLSRLKIFSSIPQLSGWRISFKLDKLL